MNPIIIVDSLNKVFLIGMWYCGTFRPIAQMHKDLFLEFIQCCDNALNLYQDMSLDYNLHKPVLDFLRSIETIDSLPKA